MEEITYCEVHPDRETALRCNRCNRLMCVDCAVRTPVGYTCRECIREQDDKYFNATVRDYAIVFVVSLLLGIVPGMITLVLGWFIFAIFVGAIGGGIIGEAGRRTTGKRVGRYSAQFATAGAVIGGALSPSIYIFLRTGAIIFSFQLFTISLLICIGVMASVVYTSFLRRI